MTEEEKAKWLIEEEKKKQEEKEKKKEQELQSEGSAKPVIMLADQI